MKLSEIIEVMEEFAPPKLAEFDYVGLLYGDLEKDIEKIGIALDYSLSSINEAINRGCGLLIVHHGPENKKLESLGEEELKLISKNNIAVYRAHLNFDFTKDGIIDNLCKVMEFKAAPAKTVYEGHEINGGVYLSHDNLTFEQIIDKIKKLCPNSIRIAGTKKPIYRKVAISSGAGFKPTFFTQLRPDAYISGELTQEAIRAAEDLRITLFEATHYSTETLPLKMISEKLKRLLPEIKVEFIDIPDSLEAVVQKHL